MRALLPPAETIPRRGRSPEVIPARKRSQARSWSGEQLQPPSSSPSHPTPPAPHRPRLLLLFLAAAPSLLPSLSFTEGLVGESLFAAAATSTILILDRRERGRPG
ncbi:Hypothetical predicted protein [Podarcis lilfordi]|uniref:Uncharacterized protein n=1 Tax=Podarcis lilfordi TaxID=74358 RepID=A0AA35KEU1_9SAUR|nr:Hypothetical predicted protein [Podarcis lilfordi]